MKIDLKRPALLLLLPLLTADCAITRSTLRTEDGAVMKNWAIATGGSRISGRDLQQTYRGRTPEGYEWEAGTGEASGNLESDSEWFNIVFRLLYLAGLP